MENRKFHVKQNDPTRENNSPNDKNNRQNKKHNLSTQMIKNKYEMTCPTDLLPDNRANTDKMENNMQHSHLSLR